MGTLLQGLLWVLIILAAAVVLAVAVMKHRRRGRFFDANGIAVHYTDEGEGEPVVLLHGFAVNSDLNWRRSGFISMLRRDFRVITMDLRGHGLSAKPHVPAQYGLEMVYDVVRLLDHLGIDKAHVVGYSLGGFITLKLAATVPQRLLSASILGAGWESRDNSEFLQALPQMAAQLRAGHGIEPPDSHFGADRIRPTRLHTGVVKLLTGRWFNDQAALAAMLEATPGLAVEEDELAGIHVPVCGIAGTHDALAVSARALEGRLKDYTLTLVPGADHVRTPLYRQTRRVLRGFLQQHRRG